MTKPVAAWIAELGRRVARWRLNRNLTQEELAEQAGVSSRTLARLESGEATQLESFLRVLEALGLGQGLERLVPDVPPSPVQQLDRGGTVRRRATGRRGRRTEADDDASAAWSWGDES